MKQNSGFRLGIDFFSGVLVGALIGYVLDHFIGTRPWLLIIFLILGFAAGINNVLKTTKVKETPDD